MHTKEILVNLLSFILMKCPDCASVIEPTGKKWTFRFFDVELLYCKICNKKFNIYYRNGQFKYLISLSRSHSKEGSGFMLKKATELLNQGKLFGLEGNEKGVISTKKISRLLNISKSSARRIKNKLENAM